VRVLLDEQLPRQLAQELYGHDVRTVQQQGWAGLGNGELLRRGAEAGFEVFLTAIFQRTFFDPDPALFNRCFEQIQKGTRSTTTKVKFTGFSAPFTSGGENSRKPSSTSSARSRSIRTMTESSAIGASSRPVPDGPTKASGGCVGPCA
jgi:hypothetical protein